MSEYGTSRQISHIPEPGEKEVVVAPPFDPFAGVPSAKHQKWWLLLLAVVSIFAVLAGNQFKDLVDSYLPESYAFPSVYNHRPSGYSGFFDLLQKAGVRSEKWEMPYRYLTQKKVKGTLVIIAPTETPTDGEVKFISQWLHEGNDLVYLDYFAYRTGRPLLNKLDVNVFESKELNDVSLPIQKEVLQGSHVKNVIVKTDMRLDGEGLAVVEDAEGAILREGLLGKGHFLVGSTPSLCANRHFQTEANWGNYQFLVNWLRSSKGPVYFDEKCHGYSTQGNLLVYMARTPLGAMALQLLLIFVIALISKNQRFGAARLTAVKRRISNLEFIDGLAATYQRARARDTVWAMIYQSFKARLCKTVAVSPHESPEVLAAAWAEATGQKQSDCEAFLKHAQGALEKQKMTEQELLELVSKCDNLSDASGKLLVTSAIRGA